MTARSWRAVGNGLILIAALLLAWQFLYEFAGLLAQSNGNGGIFSQLHADCGQIAQHHHFYCILRPVYPIPASSNGCHLPFIDLHRLIWV